MLACLCAPVALSRAAPANPVLPRTGDYLDLRYVHALERTSSPWQAAAEDTRLGLPQSLNVQREAGGRRVALNFGWHEGRLLVVVQRNGEMHRELAWSRGPAIALRIAAADLLCLAASTALQEHCYRYVGDAQLFVTRMVLAGSYVDRQGKAYRFTADGHAHFPGYDFRYGLMLEQANDPYDFFQIEEGRFMAFRKEGEEITLFSVGPPRKVGFGTPDFGHPLAVLRGAGARHILASYSRKQHPHVIRG